MTRFAPCSKAASATQNPSPDVPPKIRTRCPASLLVYLRDGEAIVYDFGMVKELIPINDYFMGSLVHFISRGSNFGPVGDTSVSRPISRINSVDPTSIRQSRAPSRIFNHDNPIHGMLLICHKLS